MSETKSEFYNGYIVANEESLKALEDAGFTLYEYQGLGDEIYRIGVVEDNSYEVFLSSRYLLGPGEYEIYLVDGKLSKYPASEHKATEEDVPKEFMKFDGGKPRIELVDSGIIIGLAQVLSFGAEKYEAHNWKLIQPKDLDRIYGAVQRHLLAYNDGERFDPESGLSHLYHANFGLMVLDYFDRKGDAGT